jgi:hypothetical protein
MKCVIYTIVAWVELVNPAAERVCVLALLLKTTPGMSPTKSSHTGADLKGDHVEGKEGAMISTMKKPSWNSKCE